MGKLFAGQTKKSIQPISFYNAKITKCDKTMFLTLTNEHEISNLINNFKGKNSSGHDNISNHVIKDLKSCLLVPLTIIFNKSLAEGSFPSIMKAADVVPLHKSKSKLDKGNYCPISLLMTLSKLLEKIVYSLTYQFMEKTNQIYDGQFGFRRKHSCENAFQNLLSDIIKNEVRNKTTIAAFLDLSKAFDTLSHPILFTKLSKYGIQGKSLDWFKSYLSNRTMRVKCSTSESTVTYSDHYNVEYGALQGSCLGPLLFSIFTNALSKHLVYTKCIVFADDTTIYMSHTNHIYLSWCIEQDLETLSDWFHANLLTLNEDKSVTLTFGSKTTGRNIRVNNICLPDITHTKFLGIWLDRGITWEYHMSRLYLKLKRNMRLLNTAKYYLSAHARKNVYYAQIYSHLTYGIIVWGNMIKKDQLHKLQKLQNKSFKALYNEEASVSNFHKHKMLRINEIIKLANMRHAHKIQYSHLPT